jgi:hypothetical protein
VRVVLTVIVILLNGRIPRICAFVDGPQAESPGDATLAIPSRILLMLLTT